MTETARSRTLGIVLAIGAVYDLLFGAAILAFTRPAAEILGLRVPEDPIYLYLNGIFLLILAAVYGAASRAPRRYPAVAPIAAAGRACGFVLLVWAWHRGGPSAFLTLGVADLVLGAATLAAWRRTRLSA
jgi:hypothetical protein